MKSKKLHFELLTRSWIYLNSFRVTNSMVKLLLFCFRVTNSMGELLFSHVQVMKIWKISNYWLENWKKTKCWSRITVIQDFFIEMKYYTIQNIWKEIGKLNFVIIDVDLALKRYRLRSCYYSTHGYVILLRFFVFSLLCCE